MRSLILSLLALLSMTGIAEAGACKITGITSASLTTAVPVGALSTTTQNAIPTTLNVTFINANGIGTSCFVAIKISGTLTSGGGQTIPYSISTAAGGSPIISFVTAPGSTATVSAAITSLQLYLIIPPGSYQSGTYVNAGALLEAFDGTALVAPGPATFPVTPTLQYLQSTCTIGGVANGGTQSLDFSNGSTISTVQKLASFGAVTCNNKATLKLTSSNGAAKSGTAGSASHQNFFDYTATTTINGGTVTLDTSTTPAVGAPESATGNITALSTTNAPLSIAVQPKPPAKPLVAGSYADVLTLTVTPD